MLVNTKAKIGVFSIALGAYLPQFPSLVPEFEAQYEAFKKTLPDTIEIIDGGMVTTKEQSQAAGDLFRAADVDLVFMQLLTYATSYNMLPAVKDLDVPVVLVNLQKLKALDYDHSEFYQFSRGIKIVVSRSENRITELTFNGEEIDDVGVKYGCAAEAPEIPEREGYSARV